MSDPQPPPSRDPRPGRRFTLEEPAPEAPGDTPRPRCDFAADLPTRPVQEVPGGAAEQVLEAGLGRPRKRRWGLVALLGGGLTLGTVELALRLPAALSGGDWLAGGWSLLGLAAIALGGGALLREGWRLRRLHRHARLREQLAGLPTTDPGEAFALAVRLKRQLELDDDHPHWQAFLAARQPHHSGEDLRLLLAHHLLAPRDREARRLISRMSGETAVMVAVSPLTLVDMALVAWRNLAMIDRLCRLYGLELGYASRLRLLRSVLYNMAFAGATEMASEAGMELLSLNLAGRLSTRAGQGLGIGLLSARLGLKTQRLTRPLDFETGDAPRIADLRGELWQQLRRLDTKEASPEPRDP
ncbi:TIGR01620 family protein [Halomonas campisalis]|uniref:TIGR01620 family protein n=1 Tax=Billgrantia campisalis TaxID=74661 RepID=A0ABS9P6I9_9GAMM|nr:TIGR01620 family protein [Halomonas campisalis]MCG6657396.1 TIGR01620 family protein [Halomonas campisalis]MDR5863259.1 TIGR01620 family protein [Halomonas campisalis]